MKLLIAEDEPVTRRLLERTLLGWDYDLVVCEDGTSAWDQIRCDDSIRIALLDWNMPPFDGIELCRRISTRKNSALLYTIVLTQREGKEDHIGALAAGAHDFISKPFDKEVLRAR